MGIVVGGDLVERQHQEGREHADEHGTVLAGDRPNTQRDEDEKGQHDTDHEEQKRPVGRKADQPVEEDRRRVESGIEQPIGAQRSAENVAHPPQMGQRVAGPHVIIPSNHRERSRCEHPAPAKDEARRTQIPPRRVKGDEQRDRQRNTQAEPEHRRRRRVDVDLVVRRRREVRAEHRHGEREVANSEDCLVAPARSVRRVCTAHRGDTDPRRRIG